MPAKSITVILFTLLLGACGASQETGATTPSASLSGDAQTVDATVQGDTGEEAFKALPPEKRIYYFEHRFLPELTYNTNGEFLDDMLNGNMEPLLAAATDMVSAEYANGISVTVVTPAESVLLTFASPQNPPDCYFAYISGKGENAIYMTYEKTEDITGEGFMGVVGIWTHLGDHANMGPRQYTDAESFVKDAQDILNN